MIVTDYIGTGDQILELARALLRNPSIRSWRSYGLIEVRVLAFAATPSAIPRLLASKAIAGVWQVEAAATFETATWDRVARDSIVELCERKCRKHALAALGYGGLGGLFATARGAPDNLPAVFWQEHPVWSPLFANRVVPADFAEAVGDYGATEELSELAQRIGQLRLGRNERLEYMRTSSRTVLAALLVISEAPRSPAALAATLGVDVAEAEKLIDSLRDLDLVRADGTITERGRGEIRAQKRARRRSTAWLQGSEAPYYPHALK